MANDYYSEIIEKIEKEITLGNYDEAYKLISEELNMPYVPKSALNRLNELENETFKKIKKEKEIPLLSKQRVLECLYQDDESISLALDTLSRGNIRNYLDVIEEYLIDVKAKRIVISLIIEVCQQQQVNKELSFYENGIMKKVNPSKLSLPLDSQIVYDLWNKIGELFENDNPSFMQICQQVLAQVAYLRYPFEIEENVHQIVKYSFKAFDDKDGWKKYCLNQNIDENKVVDIKGI